MKKFFAVLAAACLVLGTAGCQQDNVPVEQTTSETRGTIGHAVIDETEKTETTSETTTATSAPQEAEINIETLAEGEERDYNIEDILKNDLEIDSIPISIPCTLNELLETLGDDYSVDKSEIEDDFEGEADAKSKYFTGEYLLIRLYYKGESTYCYLRTIADPEKLDYDTINIIGFFSVRHYGVVNLSDLHVGDNYDKCIEKYGNPNEANAEDDGTIYLTYVHNDCVMQLWISDNTLERIFIIGYDTEDL